MSLERAAASRIRQHVLQTQIPIATYRALFLPAGVWSRHGDCARPQAVAIPQAVLRKSRLGARVQQIVVHGATALAGLAAKT